MAAGTPQSSVQLEANRGSLEESPHDFGQPPTLDERRLLYWVAAVIRTGDDASDDARARVRYLNAKPRVRQLISLLQSRTYAQKQLARTATCHAAARARRDDLEAASDAELEWALRAGLEIRFDFMLVDDDRACLKWIRSLRGNSHAPLPAGISVCCRCDRVFKPSRKAHADICSFCDRRPHAKGRPGAMWTNEDGSITVNSLIRGVYHQRTCLACGHPFDTPQGRRCCSDTCDKRWRRAGKPDTPLDAPYQEWLEECFGDRHDLREEYEAAMRSGIAQQATSQLERVRELVARSGVRPSWDELEAERRAVRTARSRR